VELDPTVVGGTGTSVVINGAGAYASLNFRLAGSDKWIMGVGVYPRGSADFSLGTNNVEEFTIQSVTGNVGIGTTTPTYKLDVLGTLNTDGIRINSGNATMLKLDTNRTDGFNYAFGLNRLAAGDFALYEGIHPGDESFNGKRRMYINSAGSVSLQPDSGSVGIGITDPAYKLDVAGDVHASGSITGGTVRATFQDVAEWVPSSGQMLPGTVVIVSESAGNTVAPSTTAYDTRVAGVVSAAPGVLLGVESSSKSKIATTGRVKVRVDATKDPIRLGDLLVTSDKPGVAMKSLPLDLGGVKIHRPGTLIGKALEPLDKGQGEILVLLSLQ
jgi:hypothetical protein